MATVLKLSRCPAQREKGGRKEEERKEDKTTHSF